MTTYHRERSKRGTIRRARAFLARRVVYRTMGLVFRVQRRDLLRFARYAARHEAVRPELWGGPF